MLSFFTRTKKRRGFVPSAVACESLELRVVPSGVMKGDGGDAGLFGNGGDAGAVGDGEDGGWAFFGNGGDGADGGDGGTGGAGGLFFGVSGGGG